MLSNIYNTPEWSAFLAGSINLAFTAIGAFTVLIVTKFSRRVLDILMGFTAGVMLAASYWSLLDPAFTMTKDLGGFACIPLGFGVLSGAVALRCLDYFLPHLHAVEGLVEGKKSNFSRSTLFLLAITLHNIPEGLAVGVVFGAATSGAPNATMGHAITLMIGIGVQNVIEGAMVSIMLIREGMSRWKAFFFGVLSGAVEPIAALFGAFAVTISTSILPFALAFAAGAMIFITIEEVIPEAYVSGNGDAAGIGAIVGFTVMMCLTIVFN